jgi:hypothetical protein
MVFEMVVTDPQRPEMLNGVENIFLVRDPTARRRRETCLMCVIWRKARLHIAV